MRQCKVDARPGRRGAWVRAALGTIAVAVACLLAGTAPGHAQAFDDTEAQLRIRQAAVSVAATQREVEELRKALATERERVVATPDERELNQETIKTLDRNLKAAEGKLRDHETALAAAQEARRKGLTVESEKRLRDEQERAKGDQERAKAEEEKRRLEALTRIPPPAAPPVPTLTDDEPQLTLLDRQKIQVALAAQGFDPGTPDGQFGARTRQMIAAWQKARNDAPTGFFTRGQYQSILQASAAAITRFERQQAAAAAPPPPPPPSTTPSTPSGGGEPYHITNNCKHPIRILLRYRNVNDEWKTAGWWDFTPNEAAYLAVDNKRLLSKNSIWYYYAETTNNTNYSWQGDHSVAYNGRTYKMRQREDKQGINKLALTCTNI